jgi:hypothetical protein
MPTDENVNASEQTVEETPPAQSELSDADIASIPMEKLEEAHPKVKELKEKHSAARKGMDDANIKLKVKPTEDDETLWLIEHASEVKLVTDEFKTYKSKGYSKEDALRLAKLDKGLIAQSKAENARQESTAAAPATVERSGETIEVPDTAQRLGVSPETIKANRALVEG